MKKEKKKAEGKHSHREERRKNTHTSNLQKLHGVSVEWCRANQSLGWVKAGGGRCMQEEEGCDALQQRDGGGRGGERSVEPLLWQQGFYVMFSSRNHHVLAKSH